MEGMGCAACVARVENTLKEQEGVVGAAVSLASNMARVDYDPSVVTPEALKKAVQDQGYDLVVPDSAVGQEDPETVAQKMADAAREDSYRALRRDMWVSVALAAVIMILGMGFKEFPGKGYTLAALAFVSVFFCGRRFHLTALRQARHFSSGMDTLVSLSTVISFLFSMVNLLFPQIWTSRGLEPRLYFESSAMIVAFILIGRTLEEKAKAGTTASIRALMDLQPPVVGISVGDQVFVKPGDRIPADGTVVSGESYVDESMLTGEPVAVLKQSKDHVFAGTINGKGAFTFEATGVGRDTMLSSIIKMVRDAQGSKAKIQTTVDKVASVFVPVIIGISVLTFILWAVLSPEDGISRGLLSMVTVLVIACPCSLGLATPTALIAGIGNAASRGILVRDADALQIAKDIDRVVFDKTGTITVGHPEVTASKWYDEKYKPVLKALELQSSHPLAEAVVRYLDDVEPIDSSLIEKFSASPGKGVGAIVGEDAFAVGNNRSGEVSDTEKEWLSRGCTVVYFYREDSLVASLAIEDAVKDSSSEAIRSLKADGVDAVMLTGDNPEAASKVAAEVGISSFKASMLPADKAREVTRMQKEGHKVAMVGDGVNDSAALATADLSVAMGKGSDVAIGTSMVTIVSQDLGKIGELVSLSKRTVRIVKENLIWAFLYNVIAVPFAAGLFSTHGGMVLDPMVGAAAMAMSSVLVVTNSLRLVRK